MAHEQKGTNITADASLTQQVSDGSVTQQTSDGSLGATTTDLAAWRDANQDVIRDANGAQIRVLLS